MIPPKIALLAGWLLALYMLRRDTQKRPDISSALWLPTLWLMRCASRGIDYWFGGEDFGRLDPILISVLMFFGLFVLLRRPCNWSGIMAHNSALFLFYGYLAVSTLWVDSLENPIMKILRPVGDLMMALIVATEMNPREAIMTLFRRCAYLLIPLSVVLIRYYPELGRLQSKHWTANMWIGVTTHKNPLGQLCIVGALAFFWQLAEMRRSGLRLRRQYLAWFYVALTLYLLNGGGTSDSRSSTAIICLMIALGLYLALGHWQNRPQLVIRFIARSALAVIAISIVLELFGTSLQGVIAATQGKEANLSGRTWLWDDVIRLGMRNPVLGTGYGGFWVPSIYSQLSPQVDNRPAESHNGYLETFANLGFVGVGLLACLLLQSLHSATKVIQSDFEYGRLRLALLGMIVIMNYSEATFPRGNHLWWYGFLLVAVYARPWVYWPEELQVKMPAAHAESGPDEEAVPA